MNNRILRIEVDGLFDRFDYTIDISEFNEGMKIITAPNGYGKSTILKIIKKFSSGDYLYFLKERFREIRIYFSDKSIVQIFSENGSDGKREVVFQCGDKVQRFKNPFEGSGGDERVFLVEKMVPFLTRIGMEKWRHDRTGEVLDKSEVFERYADRIFGKRFLFKEGSKGKRWLEEIRESINVFYIPTNRLKLEDDIPLGMDLSSYSSLMVRSIADEVRDRIQNAIRRQFEAGREKETSFPTRLIQSLKSRTEASKESLIESMKAVQQYEKRLASLGLVPQTGATKQLNYLAESSENAGMLVLKTYLDDIREKFSLLDDLARKLDVFSRSINELIAFKKVETSPDFGIVVRMPDRGEEELALSALSSGEQHLLVLVGKLIFNTKKDSLVLIDEPEISFHPEWQERFLGILDEIRRLNSFSVLIATHSPILIGDRWDSVVELAEQYRLKDEGKNRREV